MKSRPSLFGQVRKFLQERWHVPQGSCHLALGPTVNALTMQLLRPEMRNLVQLCLHC